MTEPLESRAFGASTVLFGAKGGKYPDGNSIWVRGREQSLIVDPALGVVARRDALPVVDMIVNSHCHEDHQAGNSLFPDVPCFLHEEDHHGILSLDNFMDIYGFPGEIDAGFRRVLVDQFHFTPRPDARTYRDGDVFDLGGGVRVRVIHTPGHTRGHCALHVEPDDLLYLSDIDLSSFGPYYGDAWSSLVDFERTLERVREMEARVYATFHHIGVIEDREAFRARLDRFRDVIHRRDERLLAFLSDAPHSLDEIAAHRFVYRQGDAVSFAEPVERRSMAQHLDRLLAAGRVREVESGRFLARSA